MASGPVVRRSRPTSVGRRRFPDAARHADSGRSGVKTRRPPLRLGRQIETNPGAGIAHSDRSTRWRTVAVRPIAHTQLGYRPRLGPRPPGLPPPHGRPAGGLDVGPELPPGGTLQPVPCSQGGLVADRGEVGVVLPVCQYVRGGPFPGRASGVGPSGEVGGQPVECLPAPRRPVGRRPRGRSPDRRTGGVVPVLLRQVAGQVRVGRERFPVQPGRRVGPVRVPQGEVGQLGPAGPVRRGRAPRSTAASFASSASSRSASRSSRSAARRSAVFGAVRSRALR